jgi:hypothetical protein
MHRSAIKHQRPCQRHPWALSNEVMALCAIIIILASFPCRADDTVTAIQGGDIYTISSGIIRNGTLLIKDGRIWKLGAGLTIPKGAKVIKAQGQIVMPGLVAIRGSLGEGSGARLADALDPFSQSVSMALASGVTSVYVSRGGDAVLKPTYGNLDGMLLKESVFQSLSFFSGWRRRTDLLMDLRAARTYLQDLAQFERDKKAGQKVTEPKRPGRASSYLPLLKGERTALVTAIRAGEILAVLELVDEFGIKLIINGATEGWTVAQEIAKRKVAVAMTPRHKLDADNDSATPSESNLENAAILKRAGVQFAIIPPSASFTSSTGGIAGRDLMTLPLEAAFAISGGLDEQTALEAITITPAQLLGVDDRVGSLQPGKDADIIILDGHPFHYNTFVQTTIINGKVLYEKEKSTYFSHIQH